jgi:UDP-3-O-[3-hydroxymyristoyl] glucosamine N-acyltransferase
MRSPRTYTLAEIARLLGGELLGDPNTKLSGLATLQSARAGELSFLTRGRYRSQLAQTAAAAVILGRADRNATLLPRIVCDDPYVSYARAAELFYPLPPARPGVHPSAVVDTGAVVASSAEIGPGCHIAEGAQIGERAVVGAGCAVGRSARIGADTRLYPRVTVYHDCIVGERCIVHSGAVIGADGFGMAAENGRWRKIPQVGRVVVGDDVEIGANTTIDRGALDDTVIEEGVKLDNQIQVGHNVRIGAHSALAGCVGIAGSARIGRRCTIGGAARILGHLEIADDVHISVATVVTRSVRKAGEYAGFYPMQDKADWIRNAALLKHLASLAERLRALETKIEKNTGQADDQE